MEKKLVFSLKNRRRSNISDGVFVLNFLFDGGADPTCEDSADSDDSGRLDVSDAVFLFNYLFGGGEAPPSPGADECGVDPTAGLLDCVRYDGCG